MGGRVEVILPSLAGMCLEVKLLCDKRAWKKSKRSGADKEAKNKKGFKGETRH
jgi:hypothetical protein